MVKIKYEDIPKFTRGSNYCVNVGLNYLESTLKDFKDNWGMQLNPEFQRGHVWNEEQQIKFVEFFLKGGKCESVKFNKPSWQTCMEAQGYDDMVCVDGLQRITAFLRFIRNEIKIFGYYWNEFDKPAQRRLTILVDVNDLKTEKEVLQWYVELNTGGTVHTEKEIQKVIDMIKNLE